MLGTLGGVSHRIMPLEIIELDLTKKNYSENVRGGGGERGISQGSSPLPPLYESLICVQIFRLFH